MPLRAARRGAEGPPRVRREINPARWTGDTRNWTPIGAVTLNPERDSISKAHAEAAGIPNIAA